MLYCIFTALCKCSLLHHVFCDKVSPLCDLLIWFQCVRTWTGHFLKCLKWLNVAYQDSAEDKIVKHILCADMHKLKMWTQRVYVKNFPLIRTCLMHRDSDNKRPQSVNTLLINHNMCRKTDEPKIWTLNITVLIHKSFLHYGFLKGGKRLMFKYVVLIFTRLNPASYSQPRIDAIHSTLKTWRFRVS